MWATEPSHCRPACALLHLPILQPMRMVLWIFQRPLHICAFLLEGLVLQTYFLMQRCLSEIVFQNIPHDLSVQRVGRFWPIEVIMPVELAGVQGLDYVQAAP